MADLRADLDRLAERVDRQTIDTDWVTTGQAARLLGVHPDTIRRRIADGAIPATRLPGSNASRVPRAWIDQHLATQTNPTTGDTP